MPRKKISDPQKTLNHYISTRVDGETNTRLKGYIGNSDCHSMAEVARRILTNDKITLFVRDTSMDLVMEQLALVHKDLHAIGVNINQITRYFHGTDSPANKTFHALKVAEQYHKVGSKVDDLLVIISSLSLKWLQK